MIRHYFNPMSRAASTDWMFREAGAEHEQVWVDIQAGDTRTAEYLALNPMGKVPMVVDGGVVITEVAAICAYLADKYPKANLAPAPTSALRAHPPAYVAAPSGVAVLSGVGVGGTECTARGMAHDLQATQIEKAIVDVFATLLCGVFCSIA